MEERVSPALALFLAAVRKRLNQRKISLEDFVAECKLRNKNKISIFEFAIIVQRINCGSSFFKARQLFSQINHKGQHISLETFRTLFLKASKIPLQDIELALRKNPVKSNSQKTSAKKKIVKTQGNDLQDKIMRQRRYYSQIGFNRLVKFIFSNNQKPDKIFNDCDLDKSGFIDRNEFNKFLIASEILQFKDKDVRRYLISEVLDKLKTETISKAQFFQIFYFKKPKAKPDFIIRQSLKLSQKSTTLKKIQPPKGKVMNYSVSVRNERKHGLPALHQRAQKNTKRNVQEEQSSEGQNSDQDLQNNHYKNFMKESNKRQNKHSHKRPKNEQVQDSENNGEGQEDAEDEGQERQDDQTINAEKQGGEAIEQAKKPVKTLNPVKNNQPSKPTLALNSMQTLKPAQNFQSNIYQKAQSFFRLGQPKQKDLQCLKQLQLMLQSNSCFVDGQNPKISKELTYKSASDIFISMGLIKNREDYSLFKQSDQSMNQNRKTNVLNKLIEADDIRQGEVGDCYFLSAISSIAFEYPQILGEKFLFNVNPANYYVTKLFIDGEWKYMKTDDAYPAVEDNTGYCHPRQAQIWVMLIEKSFAKVFGDYEKIDAGTQTESFCVLTGATSDFILFEDMKNTQDIKQAILNAEKKGYLMTTSGGDVMNKFGQKYLQQVHLVPGHAYSLLTAFQVDQDLVVELRNPWGNSVYEGEWGFNSKKWTAQLRKKYSYETFVQNGRFYLSWQQYLKFFGDVTICKIHPTFVHTSFRMINNKRKSNYVQVTVPVKGTYHFFICQESGRKYKNTKLKYAFSDSRIILLRKNDQNEKFEYVAAKFLGGDQETQMNVIETELDAGTYFISAKVNWTNGWNEHQCFLVSYGSQVVDFQLADRSIAPKFKSQMLSSYSLLRSNKAQKRDYQEYSSAGVAGQSYFDLDDGIGYLKVMNRSKNNYKLTFDFKIEQNIKVIKPNTVNWKTSLKAGEDAIIGFFIAGSYSYQVTKSFS